MPPTTAQPSQPVCRVPQALLPTCTINIRLSTRPCPHVWHSRRTILNPQSSIPSHLQHNWHDTPQPLHSHPPSHQLLMDDKTLGNTDNPLGTSHLTVQLAPPPPHTHTPQLVMYGNMSVSTETMTHLSVLLALLHPASSPLPATLSAASPHQQ